MTLTLNFDLLLKNFNLSHNFLTRRDIANRAFILHMWGGGQGKREGGEEGAGGGEEEEGGGRKGGGRREKRGREEGEGRKKGREGERGNFCAREARAAPEGRRETRGREGGGKGREGGEAYPHVHPLICVLLVTRPFTWYRSFDLVTLTLNFDLLLKKFNLGDNFLTICVLLWQDLSLGTILNDIDLCPTLEKL